MEQYLANIRKCLDVCNTVRLLYSDILNCYVSDYYLDNNWNKLLTSWKHKFDNMEINDLSNILDFTKPLENKMCPLSLMCLRLIIKDYTFSRSITSFPSTKSSFENNKFMNFFWKKVKLKKRHEINIMAKLCYKMAQETNCFHIVDIGSGLGHLSRMLSYGYGFRVCTFEAVKTLTLLAEKMDSNFENALNTRNIKHLNNLKTVHVNKKITVDLDIEQFLKIVTTTFNTDNIKFGIVGLHPCGDLGVTLLKLYTECPNIVFINIASCCYMKLTLNPQDNASFPLSSFGKSKDISLSYLECEIACHAIENYSEKLKNKVEYEKLKIHAYRAALEDILVSIDPELKHSIVGSVKCDKDLTFVKYVKKICDNSDFPIISINKILRYEDMVSKSWRNVVAFHSIRLLLAPLVENIILLDRLLYVLESSSNCRISPIFDCYVSPRNQVLSASKIKD